MGVAFQNATVHKCTRVTFVSVTDYIFFIAYRFSSKFPFHTGREATAATTTQARLFNFVDNFLRSHGSYCFSQSFVATYSNVLFNLFRVNCTAVSQNKAFLFFIETNFRIAGYLFQAHRFAIKETVYNTTFIQMSFNNLFNIFYFYFAVEGTFRINDYQRTIFAETMATGFYNHHFILQAKCF